MGPIADAFRRGWPQARLMNVLDDSLSADLTLAGRLDGGLVQRMRDLARYAKAAGAQGILFTCSAFGPAIEAAGADVALPTYKPNEAMFREALSFPASGAALRVGLLSTFAPSVAPMAEELQTAARQQGLAIELHTACASQALQALAAGDTGRHDALVLAQADALRHCDVVMLGQFSMAHTQAAVANRLGKPVLSSPDSAVRLLQHTLNPNTHPTGETP